MTDEALAARVAAARDPDDFRTLVDRHGPMVLRLVSSILGPFRDTDAEEIAQDVFLRVYERIGQFRGDAKFTTWLYRLAYHVAVNRLRSARLRFEHVDLEKLRLPDTAADADARISAGERARVLAEEIERLPGLYRTVIYLHYWQEASIDDMATLLAAPPNTIKSYLFRARARLGDALTKKGLRT
ncbi:MAG TPA: RNA polymerase sigma factor [Vicinamibacterales bacterium]|nr:RNA polymerase sigma factor [Vicinamibacterales bacterium]